MATNLSKPICSQLYTRREGKTQINTQVYDDDHSLKGADYPEVTARKPRASQDVSKSHCSNQIFLHTFPPLDTIY